MWGGPWERGRGLRASRAAWVEHPAPPAGSGSGREAISRRALALLLGALILPGCNAKAGGMLQRAGVEHSVMASYVMHAFFSKGCFDRMSMKLYLLREMQHATAEVPHLPALYSDHLFCPIFYAPFRWMICCPFLLDCCANCMLDFVEV